jgi:alcohol dehydrogenase
MEYDFRIRTHLVVGAGSVERIGELAGGLGFRRTLLVGDPGMKTTGYAARVLQLLEHNGIQGFPFHEFHVNPDTEVINAGQLFASGCDIDSIIGLGGGSSLDCAKGINLLLTNGGRIQDYVGYGKASKPLLPMIAVPTTAGTGSEVQSYAVLSDAKTKKKLACGGAGLAFRAAILDPELTMSQPQDVAAASGFDAIAHAVETWVSTRRTRISEIFSREAWRLLESNYEVVLLEPDNLQAREAMQLGACCAGIAIENSMLGATHACANPLTTNYGTTHGEALAMLLPTVVRWNGTTSAERYAELMNVSGGETGGHPVTALANRLEQMAESGGLRTRLSGNGIAFEDLPMLAADAADQWTGRFNPRLFDYEGALEVYQRAYQANH